MQTGRATWIALACLLALFALRLGDSARQHSFTLDEPHYVGTGLYLWETGDYHYMRALRFHPPLAYHLASLPLLALERPDAPLTPDVGHSWIGQGEPPIERLRLASRLPFVLVALWGAALCFFWAREVGGDGAGLLAAGLFSVGPSLLAHGSLAHSDIVFAVAMLQTLYLFWRWWQRPTAARLALCGLSLGLTLLAKLTAVLVVGMLGLMAALAFLPRRPVHANLPAVGEGGVGTRLVAAASAGVLLATTAIAVVWLGYGGSFASVAAESGRYAGVSLPAYLQSFLFVDGVNDEGRPVFFLGELSSRGYWSFFPIAFAIKEPVAFVGLALAAVASLAWRRQRLGLFLAIPFAVYGWILLVWLHVPLGYRYALPLLPLLCVFIATQLTPVPRGAARLALVAACVLLALESLAVHPHYLAHFNRAVGGPAAGHRYLLDANLDWGQDFTTLAEALVERGNPPVWLALIGAEEPEALGIRGRRLQGCDPVEGWLAISANVREGLYAANNLFRRVTPGCYDWLDAHEPVATPGHSIFLYDLRRDAPKGEAAR